MKNATVLLAVVAVLVLVAGTEAHAALAAYDGFDYTNGESINGQGSASDGWAGAWDDANNDGTITEDGMSYLTLSVEGLKAHHDGGVAYRTLETARGAAGTTTWISFITQAGRSDSSNWAGFSLFNGGTEKLWFGKSWSPTNWSVEDKVEADEIYTSTVIATDQVFVLIRINFATNDDIKVWINKPLDSQPLDSTADISFTSNGNNAFDRIRLCSGNNNTLDFDEVRIGDTWGDVTVPEPATMVLLGIGGIGVLIRRKRR